MIAVICVESITNRPPVIQVVTALAKLGHEVLFLGRDVSSIANAMEGIGGISCVELGSKNTGSARFLSVISDRKKIAQTIRKYGKDLELIWAATEMSARDAKNVLKEHKYIVQLPELVEYVPALRLGRHYFPDKKFPELARRAARVVVPEYNRAHIQRIWWRLPQVPAVLPNKSEIQYEEDGALGRFDRIRSALENERRRILLYQGGFTSDRDLTPFAKVLCKLDDEYALYLMGPITNDEEKETVERLCNIDSRVHYLGFVSAPDHLAFTKFGYIGLLPYSPLSDKTRVSSLNALYCAPNKTWEYSRMGLPMLSSDVPGLTSLFARNGIGVAVEDSNEQEIVRSIRWIEQNYDQLSANCEKFFKSVNPVEIIEEILREVGVGH